MNNALPQSPAEPEHATREQSGKTGPTAPLIGSPESPPAIAGLQAGLIPLREFPLRKWFYVTPLWYYHAPSLQHHLNRDPNFYELVDPLLRDLCFLLQRAGLYTTPSCQGHFYVRGRFEKIWADLKRDEAAIREGGLIVKDSETDQAYLFQNPAYALPWESFEQFYHETDAHQNKGYVGIVIPPDRVELLETLQTCRFESPCARIAFDPQLTATLGQPLLGVHVEPPTRLQRDAAWQAITTYFRFVLSTGTGV